MILNFCKSLVRAFSARGGVSESTQTKVWCKTRETCYPGIAFQVGKVSRIFKIESVYDQNIISGAGFN